MKIASFRQILKKGISEKVKSIFFFPGFPPLGNRMGLVNLDKAVLTEMDIKDILASTLTEWQHDTLMKDRELDYSYELDGIARFRVAAFHKMGSIGLVMRVIPSEIPTFEALGLPDIIKDFTTLRDGLVLITGPTGSGKSTTLAALLEIINQSYGHHIITIEDPIEFIYKSKRSIISQREVGRDTKSYSDALRRILREDPDVILVGEIRDGDSMKTAIEVAETGHLVFSTLHTINAIQSLNRIIDFFPDYEKTQIRMQLSLVLQGIVSQRLLKRPDGKGFICACEVLKVNHSVRNLIKEDKIHQIYTAMDAMKGNGAISMDDALVALYMKDTLEYMEVLKEVSDKKRLKSPKIKDKLSRETIPFQTEGIKGVEETKVAYTADFTGGALAYFDASGTIFDTPEGLLFRDTGYSKREMHYIADYTVLSGNKRQFLLNEFINLSYRLFDVHEKRPVYRFQIVLVENAAYSFNIPYGFYGMTFDRDWHTISIPVPQEYSGRTIRYYVLMFDKDIKEIFFNNIYFV